MANAQHFVPNEVVPLLDLPLDIIIEIFCMVYPLDLLQLARANKILRAYLMSSSTISIWQRVAQSYDMPPCPSHLSYPQFFNLAFDEHCHICLKPGVKEIIWTFWGRHCYTCWEGLLTDDNIADYFGKAILENVLPEALDPLYHINFIAQAKLFRLKSDLDSFRTSLRGVDSNMAHRRLWERRELTAKLTKDAISCQRWQQRYEWSHFIENYRLRSRCPYYAVSCII